jgi:hypothetical protein
MWMPATEQEILAAIEAGDLIETASFDTKVSLPDKGKSKNLAIDVAAMASDGGTLLYGVGEGENGRPAVPQPFGLAGARERVNQIVRSSISEPPDIRVREIPTVNDPAVGYLVVAVPPSPRAPHMVTVGKEFRYYGRSDTGNVPLTEGEVARLYERRQRWEIDRGILLDEAISRAPIAPDNSFAYLHLVARPVVPDEMLLDRAKGDQHIANFLDGLFAAAVSEDIWPRTCGGKGYSPDLADSNPFDLRTDGWTTSRGLGEDWQRFRDPGDVLQFVIGLDGVGRLFCGGAARKSNDGRLLLIENLLAGLTTRFLCVMGGLYAAAAYLGQVDIGLAVTGLEGALSFRMSDNLVARYHLQPYDRAEYCSTERFAASTLGNVPQSVAQRLILHLIRVVTRDRYDPFSG